ncbi:hypothetical protein OROGR_006298 [Orobanche gracilis]
MTGSGKVCASGGSGFAGGGGGRVSVNVFSRHDDPVFFVHGGRSFGCPLNSGAAGTFFDAVPRRLIIDNHNLSTDTDTLLLQFPNQPLWTNVYIQNHAQAAVPLLWSRVQVRGQFTLSGGAVLSFGLVHYALSEFELMAEELLMSDSVVKTLVVLSESGMWQSVQLGYFVKKFLDFGLKSSVEVSYSCRIVEDLTWQNPIIQRTLLTQNNTILVVDPLYMKIESQVHLVQVPNEEVYGALRTSVKIHLMLNSKMLIAGDSDAIVATSLLEASNLVVLRGSSMIHSTANLGLHGQGSLNLSGPGDVIEAQHLVLSLFYAISVGPGSILRGPLENASDSNIAPRLYCQQNCPVELLHPLENCNVNASLSFTLQICRVEDINIEGFIEGSVIHFHVVSAVVVKSSGAISASGLGCTGGLGRGELLPNGLSSGAGHGGRGGKAYYVGTYVRGGIAYGDSELPCELGSGSGNESLHGATTGGGVIVMGSLDHSLSKLVVHGEIKADGESYGKYAGGKDVAVASDVGPGGGSGGTILLFVHNLVLDDTATISTSGGHGSPNGGGGGGGRIHFHWSDIPVGDEYMPMAIVKGTIHIRFI